MTAWEFSNGRVVGQTHVAAWGFRNGHEAGRTHVAAWEFSNGMTAINPDFFCYMHAPFDFIQKC